jgi:propionate CoA-transferase
MKKNKIVSAAEAVAIIRDGDTVACSGFVGCGTPEELIGALEKRFVDTASPRDLTLVFAAAPGDGKQGGLNRLAKDGLIKRAIGGHYGLVPKLAEMAVDGRIEAYNLPLGTMTLLYRDIAGHRAGTLTKVGLGTFVDPRQEGGKANDRTTEDLVRLMEIDGEEWLFYKSMPITIALIRGTTADPSGNITMEHEALTLDSLALAMAARNSNGFVIAQVERVCASEALNPRQVQVPGVLVDCVVVAQPENHRQTYRTAYNPAYAGEFRVALDALAPMPLDARKIIARRCAFELPMNGVVNLGIGVPEGVARVAAEEKVVNYLAFTVEAGVIGGAPQGGLDFGAAVNIDAVIQQNQQFDFYDGGGLDLACLGMAQADADGNVNVSRFGKRLAGAGGFINISQNARKVVFAGTFTNDGLETTLDDGKVVIVKEGKSKKFVARVQQITFNGAYAAKAGQPAYYVTERCVFQRTAEGMELVEVAPGIDIERDILAQMDFKPIVRNPQPMDPRIFRDEPMQLDDTLLGRRLEDRVSYDTERNLLFLNLEGLTLRSRDDIDRWRRVLEERLQAIGRRVVAVVNYDGFVVDASVTDTYAAMVRYIDTHYYAAASRYSTSAFMRLKLGEALTRRRVAPHIFESADEAHAFVDGLAKDLAHASDRR